MTVDLRALQRPLKDRYRADPATARYTLRATAGQDGSPMNCAVDLGAATYPSQAHSGVGSPGTAPCSGDLLLGALAACAQITCQMVATAMRVPVERVAVVAEGELDMRGTLGIARDVPVGFDAIRLTLDVDAPEATPEQLAALREKTEQYCVILQTLRRPPEVRLA